MAQGDQPHSINSPRDLSRRQARESRQSTSTDCRDSYNLIANPRLVDIERGDPFPDDRPNKPSARILVETEINGRVDLYQFISFRHSAASSQTGGKNNAR